MLGNYVAGRKDRADGPACTGFYRWRGISLFYCSGPGVSQQGCKPVQDRNGAVCIVLWRIASNRVLRVPVVVRSGFSTCLPPSYSLLSRGCSAVLLPSSSFRILKERTSSKSSSMQTCSRWVLLSAATFCSWNALVTWPRPLFLPPGNLAGLIVMLFQFTRQTGVKAKDLFILRKPDLQRLLAK